jgi:hypothetical protein
MIIVDKNICFECSAPAEEDHHVIPQSMGGKKTIPLCSTCHSLVHGLGERRDQHKELTTRALNKKMPFNFYYVWWHYFKCVDEGDWKDVKELADDLECGVEPIKNRIKRLKEMDSLFLQEISLPYMGYEYYGTSLFNLEPYDLTDDDILKINANRELISRNIEKELGMTA